MKGLGEPLHKAFLGRIQRLGYTPVEPENKDEPTELYKGAQYIGFLLPNGAIYHTPGAGAEQDVHRMTDVLRTMKQSDALMLKLIIYLLKA